LNSGASPAMPIRYFAGKDWYGYTTSGSMRWGDYSHTTVDADGLTIWTIQEYAEARLLTTSHDQAWGTWVVAVTPF